jgi:hypothetical protein
MSETSTLIGYGGRTIGREETNTGADTSGNGNSPPGPAPRNCAALIETLGFRHIGVVHSRPGAMRILLERRHGWHRWRSVR